jgi:Protein tyrosine and serine/threonine kinase/Leucine rich repeat
MDTLDLLRSGRLAGIKRLNLAGGLTEFPSEIFDLADSLEILDLSNNQLKSLPDEFERLQNLKIAFFTDNDFEEVPAVLARCPHLEMVSFKSNQIASVGDRAFPPSIRWLILTDNTIEQLPESFGNMSRLQKLMLAGNRLRSLPETMIACQNLELVRLSANQLQTLPSWLFALPRLSWLAYAGNPCCPADALATQSLPNIDWADLIWGETLGQGASGVIAKGLWQTKVVQQDPGKTDFLQEEVAIKVFKGEITSDGLPADEMAACLAAGLHDNLVEVRGKLTNTPEAQAGLVLSLIPPAYKNLGQPPSLDSCTRDTYPADAAFEFAVILRVAQSIAAVAVHLHARGIMHGDLYAHNILVNPRGDSLLGDFGAASLYDPTDLSIAPTLERLEVRAFGCLLEELLDRCPLERSSTHLAEIAALRSLQQECLNPVVAQRPRFGEIRDRLTQLS